MNAWLQLGLAALAGCLLGLLHFGGLWLTLKRLPQLRHPGLWMAASLILRMLIVAAVFVLLARWGGWPAMLAALAAMLLVRFGLQQRLAPPPRREAEEASP